MRRTAAGVLAGALALSGAVAAAVPANAAQGFALDRLAGANRYETSAAIAGAFGPSTGAILASGEVGRSVDALSANFLAGVQGVPVLLTQRDRVPASVMARLNALTGARTITIVGGTVAVSARVETQLRGMGFTVTRLGGEDRFATSEAIITAGRASASPIGLVASGTNFPDALAGSPLAYKGKHPIFLTSGGGLPQDTIDAMVAAGTRQVIILGGTAAVPASVETALAARNITVVTRLGGAGRSETSRIIADYLIANQGFTNTTFNLASGAPRGEGADALSGGALSGKQNRVLLITDTQTQAAPVIAFATARQATLNTVGNIFGGPAAISEALEAAIEAAGRGTTAASATVQPELRTAAIVSTTTTGQANATTPAGTVVTYTFDQPVLSADVTRFQLVQSNGTVLSTGQQLVSVSGNTVTVRFTTVNATTTPTGGDAAANVNNYTLATNSAGAATDAQGRLSPEGDAAIGTAGGTTTTAAANTTTAPDLRSVGGFRQANPEAGQGGAANSTAIDFTFDQAAFLTTAGFGAARFNLVLLNGDILPCTGPGADVTRAGGGTVTGGSGTTTITVVCANPGARTTSITAAEIARAYVVAGTVAASAANAAATPVVNDNPLQSAAVTNNGLTTTADLVSAQFLPRNTAGANTTGNDQVLYVFDQSTAGTLAAEQFRVFDANGNESTAVATVLERGTDNTRVLVSFADAVLTDAVGASVGGQAGAAGTSVTIRPASVGVAPTRTGGARTPGQVDAPELRGVALSTSTSATGTVTTTATYTFDQAIGNAAVPAASLPFFNLYLADGTRLEATACAVPTNATATNTQVVCSAFVSSNTAQNTNNGGVTSATIASATLGTVEAGAVTGTAASGNTNPNPIGAENTTGGTGTPATGGGTTVTAPTVTGLSVATGGTAGGTVVTITGTNLTGATGVTFGGVAGTSFSVGAGGTSITVTTPAGTAGARDVVVLSPNGNVTRTGGFTFA